MGIKLGGGVVLRQGLTIFQVSLELLGSNNPPNSASTVCATFSQNYVHPVALTYPSKGKGDLGMVAHNHYFNTQEAEAGEPVQHQDQPALYSKSQARLCGNTRKGKRSAKASRARWLTPAIPAWEAESQQLL